jgi:hypothetical protein
MLEAQSPTGLAASPRAVFASHSHLRSANSQAGLCGEGVDDLVLAKANGASEGRARQGTRLWQIFDICWDPGLLLSQVKCLEINYCQRDLSMYRLPPSNTEIDHARVTDSRAGGLLCDWTGR